MFKTAAEIFKTMFTVTRTTPRVADAPGAVTPADRSAEPGLRARTWLIGIPLLVAVCIMSVYADMSAQVIQFGVLQFSPPAVVGLFGMALMNAGWSSVFKKPLVSARELLAIYAMLLVGVMVSTRDVVEKLAGSIAYLPYGIAHDHPEFKPFLSYIPRWMVPYDPVTAEKLPVSVSAFYEGDRGVVPWGAWLAPLCADFLLFALVTLVFLCMGAILRRQWVDVEHLSFPLTSLPVALIRNDADGKPLLSSPLLWAGIAVSTAVFGVNGLHANFPALPQIPTMIDFVPFLTQPPWNQIGFLRAYLSLAVIGFAYFMPSDVLFSLWFFYLMLQAQMVVASATGYPSNISGAWPPYEAIGAYFVLAGAMAWQARGHLRSVWMTAFGKAGSDKLDDSRELLTYRAALIGLGIGLAGILIWLTLAGMNPLLAAAEMGLYLFVTALVMSRAVAQAGLLMTETSFVPSDLIQLVCPAASLGAASLTMTAVMNTWFSRDLRGELLAPILDTQRTANQIGARPRLLLTPILVAIAVSFVVATAAFLHLNYTSGGTNLYSHPVWSTSREFGYVLPALQGHGSTAGGSPAAFGVGIAIALTLVYLRSRFAWFPFHALGFALAPTWALMVFWFGFLIAWMLRSIVLRYGGFQLYRRLTPLMLGLIIGEFTSAVFWMCLNLAFHASTPEFPWP